MVLLLIGVTPWVKGPMLVAAVSPYVAVCSLLARRGLEAHPVAGLPAWSDGLLWRAQFIGLAVALVAVFRARWFCRYGCPVGLLTEPLRRLRPSARSTAAKLPHFGRWLALATVSSAALGYPLLLWLDPLALFSGAFSVAHDRASWAGWVSGSILGLIAISAALWPNAWCLRVCPLGATQELLGTCGARLRTLGRPKRHLGADAATAGRQGDRMGRRSLLAWAGGALAAGAGLLVGWRCRSTAAAIKPQAIRPPGAAAEDQFPWLCLRCGNCVRACPEKILHPDLAPERIVGFLAPIVRFTSQYCKEDCSRCTEVCPSGALEALSVEGKSTRPIGLAHVDMSLCLLAPENGERECAFCRNACPYEAIRIEFDYQTYVATPRVDPNKCPGCGACEVACPGTNESQSPTGPAARPLRKAISVVPTARQLLPQ